MAALKVGDFVRIVNDPSKEKRKHEIIAVLDEDQNTYVLDNAMTGKESDLIKLVSYKDIPKFTSLGSYEVNMPFKYVPKWIEENKQYGLKMDPLFQRGHVWTEAQQIAYIEFVIRGGKSGRCVYFNCPSWRVRVKPGDYDEFVCIDGLQRLTAITRFVNNEIPVFGDVYYKNFDFIPIEVDISINVNDLKTEKEVLQAYVDLNEGGTPHTSKEIQKVKNMIIALNERGYE